MLDGLVAVVKEEAVEEEEVDVGMDVVGTKLTIGMAVVEAR